MSITPEKIAELKRLCEEATPAPWESVPVIDGSSWTIINGPPQTIQDYMLSRRAFTHATDTEFISAAREALPLLLAERDELKAQAEHSANFAKAEADARDKMQAERDELKAERDRLREIFQEMAVSRTTAWDEATVANVRAAAAEKERDRLREALKPFAEAANRLEDCRDERPLWVGIEGFPNEIMTVGDLRRARVLSTPEGGGTLLSASLGAASSPEQPAQEQGRVDNQRPQGDGGEPV